MTLYQCLEEMELRGYRAMYRFPLMYGYTRSVSISQEKRLIDEYGPDDQEAYIYENKIVIPYLEVHKYFVREGLQLIRYTYEEWPCSMLAAECRR